MQIKSIHGKRFRLVLFAIPLILASSGCSIKKIAVKKLGDALAESGTTFASDNDPELVKGALPFSLKLIESLLAESPRHRGLLFAACSGFTQYSYAFVKEEADETESQNFAASEMRRGQQPVSAGRDYGIRGLETTHPGLGGALNKDARNAAKAAKPADVPLLYWTAASWGLAITLSKNEPDVIADQPIVEALVDRALALDEAYDQGAIHSFLISYEPARQGAEGDPLDRARKHFDRAMALRADIRPARLCHLPNPFRLPTRTVRSFNHSWAGPLRSM